MQYRLIGDNKLKISKFGLGCMGMSECYGKATDSESIKTIHKALDLGINHFDTADCYGMGHNEQLLGASIKHTRNKVVLASKCGMVRDPASGKFLGVNGTPENIKKSCEASLKRLQTDYLNLLYLHRLDPNIPIEVTIGAMSELVKEGKVLNIGLSEVSAKVIFKAHRIHPLTVVQSEYSLWCREPEKEIIPLCKMLNIGFVAHGPLGKGFLTGTIKTIDSLDDNDLRKILPRFQDENINYNLSILNPLAEMAKNKGCTLSQLAIAWILSQGSHIVTIPGTRQLPHLEENANAINVYFSPEELSILNTQIPIGFAMGELLPKSLAQFSN